MNIDSIGYGQIVDASNKICFDTFSGNEGDLLRAYECHSRGAPQVFNYLATQQISPNNELCIGVGYPKNRKGTNDSVIFVKCNESDDTQKWEWNLVRK